QRTHGDDAAWRDQKRRKTSRRAIWFSSCGLNVSPGVRSRQSWKMSRPGAQRESVDRRCVTRSASCDEYDANAELGTVPCTRWVAALASVADARLTRIGTNAIRTSATRTWKLSRTASR